MRQEGRPISGSRLDRSALVWGAVFTMTGVAFLLQEWGVWQVRADVLLALVLIIAGALLAVTAVIRDDPVR